MSEVSKFRCMVYGCTIPAGIFHEHPDAPLMRDPTEPLDAFERAELLALRREAALRQHAQQQQRQHMAFQHAQAMQNAWPFGSAQQFPNNVTGQAHAADQLADAIRYGHAFRHDNLRNVYVVPADAPIHHGRKLRDALLLAGHGMSRLDDAMIIAADEALRAELDAGRPHREGADVGVVLHQAPEPRRSFISLTARIAFWIVLAVTVAIWIFAGVKS